MTDSLYLYIDILKKEMEDQKFDNIVTFQGYMFGCLFQSQFICSYRFYS